MHFFTAMKDFNVETKEAPFQFEHRVGLACAPHLHSHIELVYFIGGASFCYADEREAHASAGDIFIAFPNQIHFYDEIPTSEMQRPEHFILIFSAERCPDFARLFGEYVPRSPLIPSERVPEGTSALFCEIERTWQEGGEYAEAALGALLTLILSKIMPETELVKKSSDGDGNIFKQAVKFCNDNYCSPDISLDSAGTALGVSGYYISHIFRSKLNMGFKEYVNSRRIEQATKMLRSSDSSVTEIAYDCGFATTRTFNRCFFAAKKCSPSAWRKRHRR